MAFINDYLTQDEIEMFKQRTIYTGVSWRNVLLGVVITKCTIDRKEHIYLFDII